MFAFRHSAPLAVLLQRVRKEYRDVPGLSLTKSQAMRVFDAAPSVSAAVLRALVMENFLFRTRDGAFELSAPTSTHADPGHSEASA